MADLPDDLERLENIAANLRHRLAKIEARIIRLKAAPAIDPNKVQICRVNPVAYDNGQPCACPVATCNLWRGGLRPAGVKGIDRG
jgi:hypothetical protein